MLASKPSHRDTPFFPTYIRNKRAWVITDGLHAGTTCVVTEWQLGGAEAVGPPLPLRRRGADASRLERKFRFTPDRVAAQREQKVQSELSVQSVAEAAEPLVRLAAQAESGAWMVVPAHFCPSSRT